jgi:glycosyltransferase involved in cell wall biosynthesis
MTPGVTALLCPVGDVGALTAAVASLVDDPERRCAMGEAARRDAAERFPSDGVARVLSSVYDRVTTSGEEGR